MSNSKIRIEVPENSGWTIIQQGSDIEAGYYKSSKWQDFKDYFWNYFTLKGKIRVIAGWIKRKVWLLTYKEK